LLIVKPIIKEFIYTLNYDCDCELYRTTSGSIKQ
jgi:hypothetical protein